jgi:phage shock protein C
MANKTLFRSRTDVKIAGVCGGLGKYFDMDSNVWRIIFVMMLLLGSMGFWLYLACWIILPVEDTMLNS